MDIAVGLDDFRSDLENPLFFAAGRTGLLGLRVRLLVLRIQRKISLFQFCLEGSGLLVDGLRNLGKILDWNILLNGINQVGIGIQFFE